MIDRDETSVGYFSRAGNDSVIFGEKWWNNDEARSPSVVPSSTPFFATINSFARIEYTRFSPTIFLLFSSSQTCHLSKDGEQSNVAIKRDEK